MRIDPDGGAPDQVRWWRALRARLVPSRARPTYEEPAPVVKPARVWVTINGRAPNGQIWTERVDLDGRSLRDVRLPEAALSYRELPMHPEEAQRVLYFIGRLEDAHGRLRARLGDKGFRREDPRTVRPKTPRSRGGDPAVRARGVAPLRGRGPSAPRGRSRER